MDYQPGPDFLSDLPLSIIHIILALIPIRDAVRTSVLSRQWRYTWASLPHIVFDSDGGLAKRLKNIITHVLFHHKGPIHMFKLSFLFRNSCLEIDKWVLCLSRNDIRELTLIMDCNFFNHFDYVLSSIYFCKKLTNLHLSNCKLDPPPSTFKGFLFLRCAIFDAVNLSPDETERFVAYCPLLERFTCDGGDESASSEMRFSAPNLKCFDLQGNYTELCVYAPRLAEMAVRLYNKDFTATHLQQRGSVCNYTNFMGGFTNLEKLTGGENFTMYLSIGIESCQHSLMFHHLKVIELYEVNFGDMEELSAVARLIMDAPNLHKLEISVSNEGFRRFMRLSYTNLEDLREDDESEAVDVSFRDFGCAPDFTFEKLRVLNISGVSGLSLEMEFIKFLLESSPVLEMMNVYSCSLLYKEKPKFEAEIQGFARASANAKLSVHIGN